MIVANDLTTVLNNFQKNGIVFGAYLNEENKFLVCKTPYFSELTLPCVKLFEGKDVTEGFIPMFKNEFQITPIVVNYVELIRGSFIDGEEQKNGNFMCLYIKEYPDFELKEEPKLNPSGNYTDIRFITYEEAKQLYKNGHLNEHGMFYISRIWNYLENKE